MPSMGRFNWSWRRASPEAVAAREAAARQRAETREQVAEARRAHALRRDADILALTAGGIPAAAEQRLSDIRNADPEHAVFSSNLSPDEAALLRRNGYRPLGLVSGSAMYHVGNVYPASSASNVMWGGLSGSSAYRDTELNGLSFAYTEATRLAVSRMQQEATAIGASGVVAVRYVMARRVWSQKSIEVQVLGTAVTGPDRSHGAPWLSDLSGQEWYALHRAGYDPAGLVYGHCAWLILTTQQDIWTTSSWSNREMSHWSDALRQCRNRANGAVQAMAKELGSVGVMGVHVTRRMEELRFMGSEIEHHILTLNIVGTAVTLREGAPRAVRSTTNVLSLRDGRITPSVIQTRAAALD
jgi:uncharacterized protein YbjQ (UPF0145 family)